MTDLMRASALALAATTLMGLTPVETYSFAQLALLDPSARMASLCTGRNGRQSMRDMLLLAASAVQAPATAGIRLYDGLGKVHFPISTKNPEAQRYFEWPTRACRQRRRPRSTAPGWATQSG